MRLFIFDLDGTVTKKEALPIIANHFDIKDDIESLTKETIAGNIPFIESFIRRVHILGKLPVDEINFLLEKIELYPELHLFMKSHPGQCIIATGNLDCWVKKLLAKIGCKSYASSALVEDNSVKKIISILKKEDVIKEYQKKGYEVVAIGEGNNDAEGMRIADVSIACGITHAPSKSVLSVADYSVFSEKALCKLLKHLS
ncbi:HAD family phosphatase [Candidatus Woesebacteria bacterium]|nr:HAD family phosphatase [Candidatus Woesebacteria bacterium]